MKRHSQLPGVRKWSGDDLLELQSEPLKVLDDFFKEYGPSIINGLDITTGQGNNSWDVSSGLVALKVLSDDGIDRFKVMPFAGANNIQLPIYLTANITSVEREYADGQVKPIANNYEAIFNYTIPSAPHLKISSTNNTRFVDALQDSLHRFITDTEREEWNQIFKKAKEYTDSAKSEAISTASSDATAKSEAALRLSKEYTDGAKSEAISTASNDATTKSDASLRSSKEYTDTAKSVAISTASSDATTKSEAALRSANNHTDNTATILRSESNVAHQTTLRSAKDYAETIVAALVDNSPEALNTLQELAAALGNDPNFATTVMAEIGKRVTTDAFNSALSQKASTAIVTTASNGLMSSSDKTKLNGIAAGANNYVHPSGEHITAIERTTWNSKVSFPGFGGSGSAATAAKSDHNHDHVNSSNVIVPNGYEAGQYDIGARFNSKGDSFFNLHVVSGGDGVNYFNKIAVQKAYELHGFNPSNYLQLSGGTVNGTLNVTGPITQNGNQVYHSGNSNRSTVDWTARYVNCVNVYFTSDRNFKENILDVENFKNTTPNTIQAKTYNFKGDTIKHVGYIAQEVMEVYPEFVNKSKNGFLSLDYTSIHSLKIQYLEDEIQKLKTQINKLLKILE